MVKLLSLLVVGDAQALLLLVLLVLVEVEALLKHLNLLSSFN